MNNGLAGPLPQVHIKRVVALPWITQQPSGEEGRHGVWVSILYKVLFEVIRPGIWKTSQSQINVDQRHKEKVKQEGVLFVEYASGFRPGRWDSVFDQ